MTCHAIRKALAAILLAGAACGPATGCRKPEPPVAGTPRVETFRLAAPGEPPFRRFPGEVAPSRVSTMSFRVPGQLQEFPAERGRFLPEGGLLAQLDQTDFVAALDAAVARFNTARDEYARRRVLEERRAISRRELEQAREAAAVTEAALRTAGQALTNSVMRAPFDGQVAETLVENFDTVQPAQPVLVFHDVRTLEVDIHVPETDMTLVGGQAATATAVQGRLDARVEFATRPGEQFPLELVSFAAQARTTTRTFRVRFRFAPPPDKHVLPGMTCTVLVRLRPDPAAVRDYFEVPLAAVATADAQAWVWRVEGAPPKARRVPVIQEGFTRDLVRVRAPGLKAGDELVGAGGRFLADGDAVERVNAASR
ncbi:MAG: efflux RND transporter periplasmic adaptor subunit [Limisphaerales bacterium]